MNGFSGIIAVSGGDGSGKSTLLAALSGALPAFRVVTIWDLMGEPAARPLFASKAQLQVFLGSLQPESRALFLMCCLKAAMDRAAGGPILMDAYWYKYLANEIALGADPTRLRGVSALFAKPTLTLHLSLAPSLAAERKGGEFSPYECGLRVPTVEHFVEFQTRTTAILDTLVEEDGPFVPLDAALPVAALTAQALTHVRQVLP